jgi:hypothetical protein
VGASLAVWTSVIGIILGGICLGNVLGGRLADRVSPRRAVGPLFALGSFLTLFTLWMNAFVGYLLPSGLPIPWELRTVLVVCVVFLVPATVLGMVGPVVAKMAVEQARKAGSAIGDVYFWGAVGSIIGTFFCGFVLIYLAPSSIIVLLVAAALGALAAALLVDNLGLAVGLATAVLLLVGSIFSMLGNPGLGAVDLGSYQINYVSLLGNLAGCVLGYLGVTGLMNARAGGETAAKDTDYKLAAEALESDAPRPGLADLAMLAFVASLVFMSFEMVAGRLVQRYLGSGIYTWTSVIGVLLAGLSFGNFLGGKIADFVKNEKQASWLFLASSIITLIVIPLDTQPAFLADMLFGGSGDSLLQQANQVAKLEAGFVTFSLTWPFRILFVVTLVFFLPAVTMGTVSPVVAKLAVDRLKKFKRTGTAIGQVYAWGMVGSILGTFLTGFVLINVLGTKGVILILGTLMAFCATMFGPTWHAVWAGIPLGLCALAFTPPWLVDLTAKRVMPFANGAKFEKLGLDWGIREEAGDPDSPENKIAWIDESNYYYIKVNNENLLDGELVRRTLVLDNLIHGYFMLGHPERLDYDYEHIYALVAYRAAKASDKLTMVTQEVPARPTANAMGPAGSPAAKSTNANNSQKPAGEKAPEGATNESAKPKAPGGLQSVQAKGEDDKKEKSIPIPKPPINPDDMKADVFDQAPENGSALPAVQNSTMKTLFLGGGAYCFQRHMQFAYPGTEVDVAEIDPNVTRANFMATGLPRDTTIKTYWGDARQFVDLHQHTKKYDLIFGDAFNDFSVPWHLTTFEFNEKLKKMLTPSGVYMINIIDAYESDVTANEKAEKEIRKEDITDEAKQKKVRDKAMASAYRYGGFVGAWVRTAKKSFKYVYIFGTDDVPGEGSRETFVVVVSNQELDLKDLGTRADDPKFYKHNKPTRPVPYKPEDEAAIDKRARNIILTDDYAPVENLLAPVAETRGED